MANKDRNKRSARKARQAEREQREALQAKQPQKNSQKASKPKKVKERKRGGILGYFADVRAEMHRVSWPSAAELRSYSLAIIAMLIIFGVILWAVDSGIVAALVAFTGLRG